MFVELSKDFHLNLALAVAVKFRTNAKRTTATVSYPDGSKTIYVGEDARAIRLALCGASCRVCGCTDEDCSDCIAVTGEPCHWVDVDLCSRCAGEGHS